MAPNTPTSAIVCQKCLKEVKGPTVCNRCKSGYHPSCLLRVPGYLIDSKGKVFCCKGLNKDLTSKTKVNESEDIKILRDKIQKCKCIEMANEINILKREVEKLNKVCMDKDKQINELQARLVSVNNKSLDKSVADFNLDTLHNTSVDNINLAFEDNLDELNYETKDEIDYETKISSLEERMNEMRQYFVKVIENNNTDISRKFTEQLRDFEANLKTNIINSNTGILENISKTQEIASKQSLNVYDTRQPRIHTKIRSAVESQIDCVNRDKQTNLQTTAIMQNLNNDRNQHIQVESSNADVVNSMVYIKKSVKWIYIDKFQVNFTSESMKQLLIDKMGIDDVTVSEIIKTDFSSNEAYKAFKVGVPSSVSNKDIFSKEMWPIGINVQFFRRNTKRPRNKHFYNNRTQKGHNQSQNSYNRRSN